MSMFNQFFQNPYINHLPPEVRAQLQQQQMFNAGTSLLQNSYGNKGGLAAFGDAMAQFRQGQMGEATQMTEMQRLAEAMKIAQARSQGTDFAANMDRARLSADQARFTAQDETARRGQDMSLRASRERGNPFGMFPPNETDEARATRIAAEGVNAKPSDIEWAQAYWARNPKNQNTAPDAQATIPSTGKEQAAPDQAKMVTMNQDLAFLGNMSLEELDQFENKYGDMMGYRERAMLDQARLNKQNRRTRLPEYNPAAPPTRDSGGF